MFIRGYDKRCKLSHFNWGRFQNLNCFSLDLDGFMIGGRVPLILVVKKNLRCKNHCTWFHIIPKIKPKTKKNNNSHVNNNKNNKFKANDNSHAIEKRSKKSIKKLNLLNFAANKNLIENTATMMMSRSVLPDSVVKCYFFFFYFLFLFFFLVFFLVFFTI